MQKITASVFIVLMLLTLGVFAASACQAGESPAYCDQNSLFPGDCDQNFPGGETFSLLANEAVSFVTAAATKQPAPETAVKTVPKTVVKQTPQVAMHRPNAKATVAMTAQTSVKMQTAQEPAVILY